MSRIRYLDLKRSLIAGPFRICIPLLGYIFLYPTILKVSGSDVLGLWSILAALPLVLNNFDIGFSLLIKRDFSKADITEKVLFVQKDFQIAKKLYALIFGFLGLSSILLFNFVSLNGLYGRVEFVASLVIIIISLGAQLTGKLYGSVVSGGGYNYIVQYASVFNPVFTVIGSLVGAFSGHPIEGYSIGCLFASLIQIRVLKAFIKRKINNWRNAEFTNSMDQFHKAGLSLIKRGWHLYSSSLGIAVREPILRYSIAFLFGLETAGVYDIAIRVSRTGREIIASGFSSLYTIYSFYIGQGNFSEVIKISSLSLALLMSAGGVSMSGLLVLEKWIYDLWLVQYSELLIPTTAILILWNGITLLNVPFWYLLQAAGYEKQGAKAVWLHALLTIAIIPLAQNLEFGIIEVLVLWLTLSVSNQVMIFYYVQNSMKLFFPIIFQRGLLLGFVIYSVQFFIGCEIVLGGHETSSMTFLYLVAAFLLLVIAGSPLWIRSAMELKSKNFENMD